MRERLISGFGGPPLLPNHYFIPFEYSIKSKIKMGAQRNNKKQTKVEKARTSNNNKVRRIFRGETANAEKTNTSEYADVVKKTLLAADAEASMVVTHVEGSAVPRSSNQGFWGDAGDIGVVIRVVSERTPLRDFSKITKEEETDLFDKTHALFLRTDDSYVIDMYVNDVHVYHLYNLGDRGSPLEGVFLGQNVECRYSSLW